MPSWVPSVGWAITLLFIVISCISWVVLSFLDCLPIWAVTYWYMAVTFILTANSRANDTSILDTAIWNSFLRWSSLLLIFWHPELSPINLCMSPVLLGAFACIWLLFLAPAASQTIPLFLMPFYLSARAVVYRPLAVTCCPWTLSASAGCDACILLIFWAPFVAQVIPLTCCHQFMSCPLLLLVIAGNPYLPEPLDRLSCHLPYQAF